MKEYSIMRCKPSQASFTLDKKLNEEIVETAGFVPLEVKFKQFEQNGLRAQFMESDFTSSDLRQIYLSPDLQIYPGDDLIDIENKLQMQAELMRKIQLEKEKSEAAIAASDSRGGEPRSKDEKSSSQQDDDSKK